MASFVSFVILILAGMVVASPLELQMESNFQKRDTGICTNINEMPFMYDAIAEGKDLANGAIKYINANGIDKLFITYFGSVQNSTTQLGVFTTAAGENSLHWSCSDPAQACSTPNLPATNMAAYPIDNDIYLCPGFFNQVDTGHLCTGTSLDSGMIRGGTTLHEITMVTTSGITDPSGYDGCGGSRELAAGDPDAASTNASNYSCFAMQVFANTQCPS